MPKHSKIIGSPCIQCGGLERYSNNACVQCHLANARRWREENPEKLKAYRKTEKHRTRHYRSRYGITADEVQVMAAQQENCCAICKERFMASRTRHLDHDHATGKVRGLLCANCNRGLGGFRDSPEHLAGAILYLAQALKE